MEIQGVVHNGVVVPDVAIPLPEGTRVLINPAPSIPPKSFGERARQIKGALVDESALLGEAALAVDWLRPEEDAAWSHLQSEK